MGYRIDQGATFLPLCTLCPWRGLPDVDRGGALRQARHHEMRCHPGQLSAAQALARHQRTL